MITIKECSKSFDKVCALDKISMEIGERAVFGLAGSNGAGKSTLLRMTAGILRPDAGRIQIDEKDVYDCEEAKSLIFYISDDSYFPANYTPLDMARYYRCFYPGYDIQRFSKLMKMFRLDEKQRISSFSKGMKKLLLVLLGVSAGTKYLLCDETFDGLDPVVRQGVKSLFASEIMSRTFTPVIATHNLRELEDICDHVGVLHRGGILFSRNLEEMKLQLHKVQCVFTDREQEKELQKELDILKVDSQGSLLFLTVRGTREEIMNKIHARNPLFCEIIPLTLEEIFISETEVAGYEVKNIFF